MFLANFTIAMINPGARMLEDTSYQHVVRWSDMGDSFIVLDVRLPPMACTTIADFT